MSGTNISVSVGIALGLLSRPVWRAYGCMNLCACESVSVCVAGGRVCAGVFEAGCISLSTDH